jgi:hypothetical protein
MVPHREQGGGMYFETPGNSGVYPLLLIADTLKLFYQEP